MAAAVASLLCDGPVTIENAEAVGKSYPKFFSDFAALGGLYEEV
jgi:3-phosphoshikimate 1-carboxyvinyltransferase